MDATNEKETMLLIYKSNITTVALDIRELYEQKTSSIFHCCMHFFQTYRILCINEYSFHYTAMT